MNIHQIALFNIFLAISVGTTACHVNRGPVSDVRSSNGPDGQALDALLEETQHGIKEAHTQLLATYPPDSHSYIFLGRSPTPLYALMGPRTVSLSLPFSELKYEPFLSLDDAKNSDFLLQKALDHIHVYVGSFLADIVAGRVPSPIVVVDFISSGLSLGRFLNLLDLYLKDRTLKDPVVKKWVAKNGLPKILYFAMAPLPLVTSLTELQRIIAEQKINPQPARPSIMTTKLVKPGDSLGTVPMEIDTEALVQSWTSLKTGPWEGFVLNLSDPKWADLKYHLARSSFDPYAPYGSWSIRSSPLEAQRPPLSTGFLQLKKALKGKDQGFLTRCFRPRAE
jgi:hypothetical protein